MTNYPPPGFTEPPTYGPPGGSSPGGPPGKTKFAGLDPNVAAMICYLPICLNLVVAIIFFVTERDLRFVRFHAAQALTLCGAWIIVSIGLSIIGAVPGLGFLAYSILYRLLALAVFALYIFLAVRAYNNEWYKLPTLGDFAERIAG